MDRLGLDGAVSFRPGVSDAELVELYAQAAVVAVPSLYEGFSLPAVEAMACEAPVVASAGERCPRWSVLTAGRRYSTPGRPGRLAAALGQVLSSSGSWDSPATDLGVRLGREGRRRVLERFTWRTVPPVLWNNTARSGRERPESGGAHRGVGQPRVPRAKGLRPVQAHQRHSGRQSGHVRADGRYDWLGLRPGERVLDFGCGGAGTASRPCAAVQWPWPSTRTARYWPRRQPGSSAAGAG